MPCAFIPSDDILVQAYKRSRAVATVQSKINEAKETLGDV